MPARTRIRVLQTLAAAQPHAARMAAPASHATALAAIYHHLKLPVK
jgi:hypothetical protein